MDAISVKIPAELKRKLAAEAKRRNVSQSVIVRESIEQMLDRIGSVDDRPSCADLAGDLVGSIRSGRKDLATNKALLEEAMLEGGRHAARRKRRH